MTKRGAISAFFIAVIGAGLASHGQAQTWHPYESVDPITDEKFVGAIATSDGGGVLVVRCLDKVEIFFRPSRFIYLGMTAALSSSGLMIRRRWKRNGRLA